MEGGSNITLRDFQVKPGGRLTEIGLTEVETKVEQRGWMTKGTMITLNSKRALEIWGTKVEMVVSANVKAEERGLWKTEELPDDQKSRD